MNELDRKLEAFERSENGTHVLPKEVRSNTFPEEKCDVMTLKWKSPASCGSRFEQRSKGTMWEAS